MRSGWKEIKGQAALFCAFWNSKFKVGEIFEKNQIIVYHIKTYKVYTMSWYAKIMGNGCYTVSSQQREQMKNENKFLTNLLQCIRKCQISGKNKNIYR